MSALRSLFPTRAARGRSGISPPRAAQLHAAAGLSAAAVSMTGCNAIFWGNLGVLAITVGIFLGTVFLSRSSAARTATRSFSPSSSGAGSNSAANGPHT